MDAESLEMLARFSYTAHPQSLGGALAKLSCEHEHSHIADSKTHDGGCAGPVNRRTLYSHCHLQRWLDVEVALALAQTDVDTIPPKAALEIAKATGLSAVDPQQIAEGVTSTGRLLMPLLGALQRSYSSSTHEYVHFGTTTQDIQDTARSLEVRDVLGEAEQALDILLDRFSVLASGTRNALMVVGTYPTPALPTTFGLKMIGWVDKLLRHRERLGETRRRVLAVQPLGDVGVMATLGDEAMLLLGSFTRWLSLDVPLAGWYMSRDRAIRLVSTLVMVTTSLAQIVDETRTLSRWGIGELEVGWTQRQIGSSTMLHKYNPEGREQIVVPARLAKAQVLLALNAMILEYEQDYRGTRLEWCAVVGVSYHALMALSLLADTIDRFTAHGGIMARIANIYSDTICTEVFAFGMAKQLGRSSAYEVIFGITQVCQRKRIPMRQALEPDPRVGIVMPEEALARLFEPRSRLGMTGAIADRVLDKIASHHRITHRQEWRYCTSTENKNDKG